MPAKDKSSKPRVFAFDRKLDPSDALFYAGRWEELDKSGSWPAVALREKAVRGTPSHHPKSAGGVDSAKRDMAFESPNPQRVDIASLPHDADTLNTRFTLRVLPNAGKPCACDRPEYQERLQAVVQEYVDEHGFTTLATRYAHNIANGRFLWRNLLVAEDIKIHVRQLVKGQTVNEWAFDAFEFTLRSFEANTTYQHALDELAAQICAGLAGEHYVLLEIEAFARVGAGQEVFPSQEMIMGRERGTKSKTLYDVSGVASMHSQKIGNALRTIDTSYPNATEKDLGPIAIEPFGAVTSQGIAYRRPTKTDSLDFYTLLHNWVLEDKKPDVEQQHFVMATLIRGGVFGEAGS